MYPDREDDHAEHAHEAPDPPPGPLDASAARALVDDLSHPTRVTALTAAAVTSALALLSWTARTPTWLIGTLAMALVVALPLAHAHLRALRLARTLAATAVAVPADLRVRETNLRGRTAYVVDTSVPTANGARASLRVLTTAPPDPSRPGLVVVCGERRCDLGAIRIHGRWLGCRVVAAPAPEAPQPPRSG